MNMWLHELGGVHLLIQKDEVQFSENKIYWAYLAIVKRDIRRLYNISKGSIETRKP